MQSIVESALWTSDEPMYNTDNGRAVHVLFAHPSNVYACETHVHIAFLYMNGA